MKADVLAKLLDANTVCGGVSDKDIRGGYCGDFLSFVMGKAPAGAAWFTVMSNVNVAAVAYMAEVGAVVLCENVKPDPALTVRCEKEGIPLFMTPLDAYHAAARLALYEDRL